MNINVSLPKELADFVEDRVRSGEFASTDDVIGEALRMFEAQSQFGDIDIGELRELWNEGIQSGNYAPLDLEAVKAEGRRLLKASS